MCLCTLMNEKNLLICCHCLVIYDVCATGANATHGIIIVIHIHENVGCWKMCEQGILE